MQILGLLGMHFDAVAVEVEKSLFFFQIGSDHTVVGHISYSIQSKSELESDTSITVGVSSFLLMTFGVSSFLLTPFGCGTDIIRGFLIFVRLPGKI